ncbi:MAG: aminotransferase class I/II-fold pyridoxal phosphate-dependent enzyme [Anaerolineales bacterium]|nr:aminotransferase class I/II-fold pyridoxal phosphate-dependent enzyme [Anaerolineales bacterium]
MGESGNLAKTDFENLAIFGKTPTFTEPLHVGRPNIGDREQLLDRINTLLDRRWLTNNGPFVKEFEDRIAAMVGIKHCIAMCNATIALEIAIRALGLSGEVIVPSFTFVATAHALQWQEITPVFCDVAPGEHHIDPKRIEAMITPRTTGIIGVHVWGKTYAVDALEDIARRNNLRLLFDAAHAFNCTYKGQMIGNFGDAEVFSFHATKFVNAFEGGCVVTADDHLAEKMRYMRNFGFAGYDDVQYVGINGKMSEISAAMGLTSLESIDEVVAINHRNYQRYQSEMKDIPGIRLVTYDIHEQSNYQYIILEVDETITGISRDLLVKILHAENVLARRYFYPGCHQMEPYRSYFPHAGLLLPHTEKLVGRVMSLPTGTSVDIDAIDHICGIIRLVVQNGPEITRRLSV